MSDVGPEVTLIQQGQLVERRAGRELGESNDKLETMKYHADTGTSSIRGGLYQLCEWLINFSGILQLSS